jgi:hypothetical protein
MNHEVLIANVQDHIETEWAMRAVPEGSKIVCPNKMCQAPLFEFVKQLDIGQYLSLDHIRALRPDALKSTELCQCPSCGHEYMKNGAISTHFGWFPYQP